MLFSAKQQTQATLPQQQRRSFDGGILTNSAKDYLPSSVNKPRPVVDSHLAQTRYSPIKTLGGLYCRARIAAAVAEGENNAGELLNEGPRLTEVDDKEQERSSELRVIIQTIHGQHLELLSLTHDLREAVDKLKQQKKEEKKLQLLLDKCSLASHVLYQKNTEKESRILELKTQLELLQTPHTSLQQ